MTNQSLARRVGLWAFVVAGLLLVAWGLWSLLAPSATCRGEVMHPGDECSYSSRTQEGTDRIQTYEQRIQAARDGAPTVIVLGLAVAGFGTWLAVRGARRGAELDAGQD